MTGSPSGDCPLWPFNPRSPWRFTTPQGALEAHLLRCFLVPPKQRVQAMAFTPGPKSVDLHVASGQWCHNQVSQDKKSGAFSLSKCHQKDSRIFSSYCLSLHAHTIWISAAALGVASLIQGTSALLLVPFENVEPSPYSGTLDTNSLAQGSRLTLVPAHPAGMVSSFSSRASHTVTVSF